MSHIPLLIEITLALVAAFLGGIAARRLGLPTIVGYLLAGIVIGPFTPGFVGDAEVIQQLAELGVIFLMFGVGLHFSFKDLWKVRDIAIPGALFQTTLATLLGVGLSRFWGWSLSAGIMLGLSISVASTVVLLRGLMDNSLLNTSHGHAAVGWLVMEDILSVLILVLLPAFTSKSGSFEWTNLWITLIKAGSYAAIMYFAGARLIPAILTRIANLRSRELFILTILAVTLGSTIGAAELFGVSLALGAFVAGAIISQSRLSYQVGADVVPFREAFAVLFFVSIGMLVNPIFLWQNLGKVISLTALIIIGKTVITILLGLIFPRPARTILVIAIGLSQIGEFSFILGQAGLTLGLMTADQYSLILAGALISITINPMMYRLLPQLEKAFKNIPWFWKRLDLHIQLPELEEEKVKDHVVIVGYGRIGKHLGDVLSTLGIPLLVVESDAERINMLNQDGIPTLFGDASNSEVIMHAGLERARIVVITVPEEDSAFMIVSAVRTINPDVPIIVRAATDEGTHHLARLKANLIVNPEYEGGLEIIYNTLLQLGFPLREVHDYSEAVRRDSYAPMLGSSNEYQSLHALINASTAIEISWIELEEGSPLIGQSLLDANLRMKTGASIVALIRQNQLFANPKSITVFEKGDRIGVIGEKEQINHVNELVRKPENPTEKSFEQI